MKLRSIAALVAVLFLAFAGGAQTTAFTYQGQLNSSNAPANGLYDFRFRLFDVNSNVVAGPLTNSPTGVTNGAFIVTLNFGATVFDGSDRWLEIAVRGYGDTNAYTALAPLQQITSTPYAIRALNAANATSLVAPLQGTNITGTIPVTNLPSNVAFLNSNQTFTAANTLQRRGDGEQWRQRLFRRVHGQRQRIDECAGDQPHRHAAGRAVVRQRGAAKQSQLEFCRRHLRHQFHRGRPRADQRARRVFLGDGDGHQRAVLSQRRLPLRQRHHAGDDCAPGVAQRRGCHQSRGCGRRGLDSGAKCRPNHPRRKSFGQRRPKLDGARQQPGVVIRRVFRRRNKTRCDRRKQFERQRLHLHLNRFRRDLDCPRQRAAMGCRGVLGGWDEIGRCQLHRGGESGHLHFGKFRRKLDAAIEYFILFRRGFFSGWNQTGGGSQQRPALHFGQFRESIGRRATARESGARWRRPRTGQNWRRRSTAGKSTPRRIPARTGRRAPAART